ncbi:MAG: peptidoglycan DD-metalloendopeptidase family protein [Actinobacteria bacterium]|nr:peptidoglycan DD-metalloendopeptidase family protein [Actinomycetota bacterium]
MKKWLKSPLRALEVEKWFRSSPAAREIKKWLRSPAAREIKNWVKSPLAIKILASTAVVLAALAFGLFGAQRGPKPPAVNPQDALVEDLALMSREDADPKFWKTNRPAKPGIVIHEVVEGESIWSIARQYNVDVASIIGSNAGVLDREDLIKPGLKLEIPTVEGVIHTVANGDTLSSIASKYDADVNRILLVNNLDPDGVIAPGQKLIVPGAKSIPKPRYMVASRGGSGSAAPGRFIWPTRGPVTSWFGPRWGRMHTGIDIAGPVGQDIVAARSGTVTSVGWIGNYGQTVIIDHGGGISTWYAHTSRILVKEGQWVEQGDLIARLGSTGWTTGPNLHFEVRINRRPVDPAQYLR